MVNLVNTLYKLYNMYMCSLIQYLIMSCVIFLQDGWNPMHCACAGRHLEVIQLLRRKGLDLHTPKDKVINTYLLVDT